MKYLDMLLNAVGLLMWLNWRSFKAIPPPSALSLASLIRPAERKRTRHLVFVGALPALLGLRALFYYQIGPPMDWTPQLSLGAVVLSFRGSSFWQMLAFSVLSWGLWMAVFYFCLLLLAAINYCAPDTDPWLKLSRLHLGRVAFWPPYIQLLLPYFAGLILWPPAHAILQRCNMAPAVTNLQLFKQSAIMGISFLLSWQYLLIPLLTLYFLNTYIYFGSSTFWAFVNNSGRNLLAPLRWLRVGRIDLAAPLMLALVVAGSIWLSRTMHRFF